MVDGKSGGFGIGKNAILAEVDYSQRGLFQVIIHSAFFLIRE
jgi:hypothetical protein